jgi:hypothetical protein
VPGVGQKGQRIGAKAVDNFRDDKGRIDGGGNQEARTEVGRGMVVVVAVMPVSLVSMIMAMVVVVPMVMVVLVTMFMVMPVVMIMIVVRHDPDLSFFAVSR